ncbi:MAG: DNA repair protein RecO [Lewinellaceae bacterium]|nr:DNA repair protein RecO [Lewinellaceae bacterium]
MLHTRGIVFRAMKYGDTSVIADIFTEEKGLHTFIGGSVRTARSRMPFNLFQSMTVVDMVAYFRENSASMHRLKEMRASEVFTSIPFDIRRGAVTLFMAEICRKCVHDHEPNQELFHFLCHNLQFLDSTDQPIANLHLHFLIQLTAYLGFQPQGEPEGETFFDLREGEFSSVPAPHGAYLEATQTEQLLFFWNRHWKTVRHSKWTDLIGKHCFKNCCNFTNTMCRVLKA